MTGGVLADRTAIVTVASDDAGFISGSVHAVDGGILSVAPYAADMREYGTQPVFD